jgi:hypothetical protein
VTEISGFSNQWNEYSTVSKRFDHFRQGSPGGVSRPDIERFGYTLRSTAVIAREGVWPKFSAVKRDTC